MSQKTYPSVQDGYTMETIDIYGIEGGIEKIIIHGVSPTFLYHL